MKKSCAMKRSVWIMVCVGFLCGWTTFADARAIKFSILLPAGGPGDKETREVFDKLSKDTHGDIQVKIYAGGVAGDEVDIIRKMRVNRIHMGGFTGNGLGQIVPEIRVLEAPGLIRNYAEEDYIKEKMFDHFAAEYEKKGFTLLGLGGAGFVYVFSKKELNDLNGLKQLKMWTWKDDPLAEICFSEMGMNTIPLHLADVITGIETGMIDTFYITTMGCTALQWYTRCRYMLDYPATMVLGGILINKKTFHGFSPQNQRIMKEAIKKSTREQVEMIRQLNAGSKELIREVGVQIIEPSREVAAFIEEGSLKGTEKCIEKGLFSREIYNRVKALLDEYRATPPEKNVNR